MNGDKKLATLGLVIAKSYVSDDMPKCPIGNTIHNDMSCCVVAGSYPYR